MKASHHHGSKSLDLTIPHSVCKEHDISDGDVFILDVATKKIEGIDKLVLQYTRVYAQEKKGEEGT